MDAQYLQSLISEFIRQLINISNIKEKGETLSGRLIALEDMLYDYMESEIINRGYFYYDSNKKYNECDEIEREWAIAVNQMSIDVFGKSVEELLKKNTHILVSANENKATLYINDGKLPLFKDKKIEIKSQQKKSEFTF